MANYCINSISFCSKDEKRLKKLFTKIRTTFETLGQGSVSNLFELHGYSKDMMANFIDLRDDITGCDGIISKDGDTFFFSIETQSAWEPHIDVFFKLIQENYQNQIRVFHYSEEPGDNIFVTNDVDAVFFKDRYKLYLYTDGKQLERYFTTWKALLSFVNDTLHITARELDSIQEVEEKIITECLLHYQDTACFINRITVEEERMVA